MKIPIIIFSFIILLNNAFALKVREYEKKPKSFYNIGRIVSRYEKKKLVKNLRDFVLFTRPSRYPGTTGHKKAIPWLLKKLKDIGSSDELISVEIFTPDISKAIASYEDDFNKKIKLSFKTSDPIFNKWRAFTDNVQNSLKKFKGLKGSNLVWEKKGVGTSKEVLILGAHFDTIAYDSESTKVLANSIMPGADDNGTGVATLLAIIEILNKLEIEKTVRIIFFDFQELGFLGSLDYTNKHKYDLIKNVTAYINVEMLGNDTKLKDTEKKLKNYKAYIRPQNKSGHKKDLKIAENFVLAGKKSRSNIRFEIKPNGYANSDHINFWNINVPAVAFTQNIETDYNKSRHHTSNDFPEAINTKSFYEAYKFLAAAVISWSFDITR
jgi:Zn-dependent M28 family amino/carboxypeptidase